MGFDREMGPLGCRLVGQELECVCERIQFTAPAQGAPDPDHLIDELAQIIDYRAYFEWGVYRDRMLADGKDEATAAKMADYHWLHDKKLARVKARQIIDRFHGAPVDECPRPVIPDHSVAACVESGNCGCGALPPAAPVETDPLYDSRNPNHGRTGGLRDPDHKCSSAATEAETFDITWRDGAYYVSIPNYKGGKVYTGDYVERLRGDLRAYEITFKRIAEEDALTAAEPQPVSVPQTWRGMDSAPKDVPILIVDDRDVIGEAYYDGEDDSWWWANTSRHDYVGHAAYPRLWQPMPDASSLPRPEWGE